MRPPFPARNDDMLKQLFVELQNADEPERANDIALKIWNRWMSGSGDAATDEKMERGVYFMQTGNLPLAEKGIQQISLKSIPIMPKHGTNGRRSGFCRITGQVQQTILPKF
jgi:hypothetical protein